MIDLVAEAKARRRRAFPVMIFEDDSAARGAAAQAEELYEQFLSECAALGFPPQHGEFGAYMQVTSLNDGPVTLIIDTRELKL